MAQKKIQTMKKLFFFIILLLILSPISIAKHHLKSPEIAKKNKYKNHKKILNQNQKKDQLYQKEKKAYIQKHLKQKQKITKRPKKFIEKRHQILTPQKKGNLKQKTFSNHPKGFSKTSYSHNTSKELTNNIPQNNKHINQKDASYEKKKRIKKKRWHIKQWFKKKNIFKKEKTQKLKEAKTKRMDLNKNTPPHSSNKINLKQNNKKELIKAYMKKHQLKEAKINTKKHTYTPKPQASKN